MGAPPAIKPRRHVTPSCVELLCNPKIGDATPRLTRYPANHGGLVASLARPGGNATGLTNQTVDLAGKRIELLREIVPGLRQLAVMANVDNPSVALDIREVEATARALGLEVAKSEIRRADDIAPAIEALRGKAQALYVPAIRS
jgi:ABC-type uncharacterized transport system substrate-binding protein